MLRIGRALAWLKGEMLRLDPESQHPGLARQPLVYNSQLTDCLLQQTGVMRNQSGLDSQHNGPERLLLAVPMLRKPGIFLLRNPGMLRLGGDSQHPTGGQDWRRDGLQLPVLLPDRHDVELLLELDDALLG
jgi:hypothetical protein